MTKDKDREISYLTLCVETLKAENETLRQNKDQVRLWNENELLRRKLAVAVDAINKVQSLPKTETMTYRILSLALKEIEGMN
jgi:hypothetical protein